MDQPLRRMTGLPPGMWSLTIGLMTLCLLLGSGKSSLAAVYEKTVTGTVTTESGEGLPGVSVQVKGTSSGGITDVDGKYSVSVPDDDAVLLFSFIGYKNQEVTVGARTNIDVVLIEDVTQLDELIVIGYGTEKKETITGSVATVGGDMLQKAPAANITQTLTGRLPGLVVVQRSGEPGNDGATLRIRGLNTLNDNGPLVVVDGIPYRSLDRINPNDIESVTVLKDASAAIYGAQAANGVILVTTKRGKVGKPQVQVSINRGLTTPTVLPEMADAPTYLTMINENLIAQGKAPKYPDSEIQNYRDGTDPWRYPNTDWFAETFKPWAAQNNNNLSINGGGEYVNYFVSIGNRHQDGIYKNSATYYDQYNMRANIDGKINENIKIGLSIEGRQEERNYPTRSVWDIFWMLVRGKPHLPAYWPNGLAGPDIEYGNNPVVITTAQTGYDKTRNFVFQSNINLDVKIPWVDGLSVTANASLDKNLQNRKTFRKPWYLYTWDGTSLDTGGDPLLVKGQRGFSEPNLYQRFDMWEKSLFNARVNYETEFGNSKLKLMAGTEGFRGTNDWFDAYRRFFISDQIDQMFAGGDLEKNNNGSAGETYRVNYFGRVNYNLSDKYLAEFVWRYDGSSIFPTGKNFGFFPGISVGWRISEENFWSISQLDNVKIRASYGQTGNDRVPNFQFINSFAFSGNTYVMGGSENKMLYESQVPNPGITWEIANQTDFGIEGQVLDGKLYFELDYFNNLRTSILWNEGAAVPGSVGITNLPDKNIGKVSNKGFEFLLEFNQDISSDLSLKVGLNGGYAKNKILYWAETPGAPDYQKSTGYQMFSNLYYEAIGVFNDDAEIASTPSWPGAKPGDVIFKDINGDGEINGLDKTRINKNEYPTFTGGANFSLNYKQFDASIFLQAAMGAQRYIDGSSSGEIGNYIQMFTEDRWTPENPNGSNPRAWNRGDEYWVNQANTHWLRSTDYLRVKSIEVGYNFSSSVLETMNLGGLRLYVSGLNLLTFDKVKVFDPESVTGNGTYYPLSKVVNAGALVTF